MLREMLSLYDHLSQERGPYKSTGQNAKSRLQYQSRTETDLDVNQLKKLSGVLRRASWKHQSISQNLAELPKETTHHSQGTLAILLNNTGAIMEDVPAATDTLARTVIVGHTDRTSNLKAQLNSSKWILDNYPHAVFQLLYPFLGVHPNLSWLESESSDSTLNNTFFMIPFILSYRPDRTHNWGKKTEQLSLGRVGTGITWGGAWRIFWDNTSYILIGSSDTLIYATVKNHGTLQMCEFSHINFTLKKEA